MPNCNYTLEDLLDFELPEIEGDICEFTDRIIKLALMQITKITLNPCAFETIKVGDTVCGSEGAIKQLNTLIKCMQDICCKIQENESWCYREVPQKPCGCKCGRRCKGRLCGGW